MGIIFLSTTDDRVLNANRGIIYGRAIYKIKKRNSHLYSKIEPNRLYSCRMPDRNEASIK